MPDTQTSDLDSLVRIGEKNTGRRVYFRANIDKKPNEC